MKFYGGFFNDLYKENEWTDLSDSHPKFCKKYMEFVEIFMERNNISSVLDVGCGLWNFSQHMKWGDRKYHGIDVAPKVILENKNKFETDNITFQYADIFGVNLNQYDLILCKDVFQHLPLKEIELIMNEICYASKIKHYIVTNDAKRKLNADIGGPYKRGRGVDITKSPFGYKAMNIHLFDGNKLTQYK